MPDLARTIALDNLANGIAYASDFDKGGEDIAYALYVLARAGRAAIGDLRYYADSKLDAFATPLAKAQLGAALALYGDRARADRAFAAAMADLDRDGGRARLAQRLRHGAARRRRRADAGRRDRGRLGRPAQRWRCASPAMERDKRYTSTQEDAWMLLAAAALSRTAAKTEFSIDGETHRRAALPPLQRRARWRRRR